MATGGLSWQAVARRLARRLVYHAECSEHPAGDPVLGDCPFCEDRAAYELFMIKDAAYQARHGGRAAPPGPDGGLVREVFVRKLSGPSAELDPDGLLDFGEPGA